MQLVQPSKYHLKNLHQEIDLYDRKIAHCQTYEKFDSEAERSIAVAKLAKKRKGLVESAAAMASTGIEYDPNQLPRSLKSAETSTVSPSTPSVSQINKVASPAERRR